MKKKPWRVVIPDHVLAKLPPEEREKVRAEIEALFKDFDPLHPPAGLRQAIEIEVGIAPCPKCDGPLKIGPTTTLSSGDVVDLLDCYVCDETYQRPAAN